MPDIDQRRFAARPTTARQRAVKRDITDLTGLRAGLYCRVSKDGGDEKSVNDQETVGHAWASQQGAVVAGVYRDVYRSASRYATRERESFNRLLADIRNDQLDLVWFWELSRSQRRLGVFADLRDL